MLAAVVVTHNRRELLERCLLAISAQSQPPDCLLVIDNASTDGTPEWLSTWLPHHIPYAEHVFLLTNYGGAGGFAEGLRAATKRGADWIWMMDDDAQPHQDALEHLMAAAKDTGNIYGSIAVNGLDTSWTTTLIDTNPQIVDKAADVPATARVQSLPFLGFMIHRDLVNQIGLPDAGFFIAADDIEYCLRAERAGAQIIVAGNSRIEHPKSERYLARTPARALICLRLPPWKRYYDIRNRVLIARKYYGLGLVTQTIPGSFVRLLAALRHEPQKLAQLWAFCAGMTDGLLGLKGRRHEKWHIPQ